MDSGGQTQCSISTSDAQVHLEPDAARSLIDARTPQAVILSREERKDLAVADGSRKLARVTL